MNEYGYEPEEKFLSPETGDKIKREQVIAAYKKFAEQGIKNPDDLDLNDPEVQKANDLFEKWVEQEDELAGEDDELRYRNNLAKTMFYVDAGFTDPDYLDEILNDQLVQENQETEEQKDNPERAETRRQIAKAMEKIKKLLPESE